MENFKCVDYFQVEYFQRKNPAGTVQMTPRINRHRRSVEIEESIHWRSFIGQSLIGQNHLQDRWEWLGLVPLRVNIVSLVG